ncbi:MAG: hypothetical protein EXX96DRAFT_453451, partial [Benjaminiella poitrasii]
RDGPNSKLLSVYQPALTVDPILWLPISYIERNRILRWNLDWLPGGRPQSCLYHPNAHFSGSHAIHCLHLH